MHRYRVGKRHNGTMTHVSVSLIPEHQHRRLEAHQESQRLHRAPSRHQGLHIDCRTELHRECSMFDLHINLLMCCLSLSLHWLTYLLALEKTRNTIWI